MLYNTVCCIICLDGRPTAVGYNRPTTTFWLCLYSPTCNIIISIKIYSHDFVTVSEPGPCVHVCSGLFTAGTIGQCPPTPVWIFRTNWVLPPSPPSFFWIFCEKIVFFVWFRRAFTIKILWVLKLFLLFFLKIDHPHLKNPWNVSACL